MQLNTFFSVAAVLAAPALVSAQTVAVNKAGTAGAFTSISDALASFTNPEDITLADSNPNVIQVTDAGIYEEVISILTPVTLEATGAERATIELLANPNGFAQYGAVNRDGAGGIFINLPSSMTTGTVKIKNFNILPSLNSTLETRLRSAIENGNNNLYLELDNVLITANDNHKPLNDDPTSSSINTIFPGARVGTTEPPVYTYPAAYDPAVVQFGAHGIMLGRTFYPGAVEGAGVELLFKNSVIHTLRNDYYVAATEPERAPTGIVIYTPWTGTDVSTFDQSLRRIMRIEDGGGISFCRAGISSIGDLLIESSGERVQMRGHGNQAIRLDGPAFNYRTINDLVFTDNSNTGILDNGMGNLRWTMKNNISFVTLNRIFQVQAPGVGDILVEDSTLVGGRAHNGSGHPIEFDANTQTNIHFRNSILGGRLNRGTTGTGVLQADVDRNTIRIPTANILTVEGTAIIRQGPYAFRTTNPFSRGGTSSHPAASEYVSEDPVFAGINPVDPASPDFLDVQNTAYATAGTGGMPLGGGADYIGGVNSNVNDWNLY